MSASALKFISHLTLFCVYASKKGLNEISPQWSRRCWSAGRNDTSVDIKKEKKICQIYKSFFFISSELTPCPASPRAPGFGACVAPVILRWTRLTGNLRIPFFFDSKKEHHPLFRMENRKTQMVLFRKVGSHIFVGFWVFGNSCCPRQSKVENMAAFAVACCTKGCSSLHPSCSSHHQCTDCKDE